MATIHNVNPSGSVNKLLIDRIKPLHARVGILGVGHHTYWHQFEGLLDELLEKLGIFEQMVRDHGVETVNLGMSDCAETAYRLVPEIQVSQSRPAFYRYAHLCDLQHDCRYFQGDDVPMVW